MWSLGCILVLLLLTPEQRKTPVFTGANNLEVLINMVQLVASDVTVDVPEMIRDTHMSAEGEQLLNTLAHTAIPQPKQTLMDLLENADEDAVDMAKKLLVFNPAKRMTAQEALRHPFMTRFFPAPPAPVPSAPAQPVNTLTSNNPPPLPSTTVVAPVGVTAAIPTADASSPLMQVSAADTLAPSDQVNPESTQEQPSALQASDPEPHIGDEVKSESVTESKQEQTDAEQTSTLQASNAEPSIDQHPSLQANDIVEREPAHTNQSPTQDDTTVPAEHSNDITDVADVTTNEQDGQSPHNHTGKSRKGRRRK